MNIIKIEPRFFKPELIQKVEKSMNATFVVESQVRGNNRNWMYAPVAIFYTPEKHPVSNSNYFGFYYSDEKESYFVMDGQSAADEPFTALKDGDGYVHSVYRHDMVWNSDLTAAIDGGREYLKVVGNIHPNNLVSVQIVGDHLEIIEEEV